MLVTFGDLDCSVTMPPRRILQRNENGKEGPETPPPPSPDTMTRMLEGMTQLLERAQGAPRAQQDVYERFRRLYPKDFRALLFRLWLMVGLGH